MGNDIDVLTITRDDGWGSEGEDWVLHTSVWERGRKDENIVLSPCVWEDQLLGDLDEVLGILLQLPLSTSKLFWSTGDARSWADLSRVDLTGGEGEEVRCHWHSLLELVKLGTSLGLEINALLTWNWNTRGDDWESGVNAEIVGRLGIWSVLAREQRSGVDGLTLGEHVWVLPLSLGWREPLKGSALLGGGHLDSELDDRSLGGTLIKLDGQGRTIWLNTLGQRPLRVVLQLAIGLNGDDIEEAGVEDNGLGLLLGLGLELKSDSSIKLLILKVDKEISNSMLRPPLVVVGQGVRITRMPVDAS